MSSPKDPPATAGDPALAATAAERGPAELDARAVGWMIGLSAIWGLGQIAVKVGVTGISPLWQAGLRSLLATIVLLGWMKLRDVRPWPAREIVWPALVVGVLFALEFVGIYAGMALTAASRGTILIYCAPFVVALGGHIWLGDRLRWPQWLGLLLAFLGVATVILDRGTAASGPHGWLGDLLCLGAGVFWGATTLVIRATALRREAPQRTLLYQLAVSALLLMIASPLAGEAGVHDLTPLVAAAFAYQVLAVVCFGYLWWFILLERYSPARLSSFTFLTPLFGVLFAALLLREPLTIAIAAGAAATAVGIYLVNAPRR